jgi:hypothetical protein
MSEETSKKKNDIVFILAIVNSALILLLIAFVIYDYLSNKKILKDMRKDILINKIMVESIDRPSVDLTVSEFQDIGDDFAVTIETVEPHLSGFKVRGRMLNITSVALLNVKFGIHMGEAYQNFTIDNIRPGHAARFEVYVPNLGVEDTDSAEINYRGANISYTPQ